jgi:hypothetical protein
MVVEELAQEGEAVLLIVRLVVCVPHLPRYPLPTVLLSGLVIQIHTTARHHTARWIVPADTNAVLTVRHQRQRQVYTV